MKKSWNSRLRNIFRKKRIGKRILWNELWIYLLQWNFGTCHEFTYLANSSWLLKRIVFKLMLQARSPIGWFERRLILSDSNWKPPYFSMKTVIEFLSYFEPKFTALECWTLESNRFDFLNQRCRVNLELNFDQHLRKLRIMTGTPLMVDNTWCIWWC